MSKRRAFALLVVLVLSLALFVPAYSAMNGENSSGDDDRWSDRRPWTPESEDDDSGPSAEPADGDDDEQDPVEDGAVERAGLVGSGLFRVELRVLLNPFTVYFVIR